jgi:hypothetical protein
VQEDVFGFMLRGCVSFLARVSFSHNFHLERVDFERLVQHE